MEERFKLYNGDCLEVMDELIGEGVKVDVIITDPPYGTTACKWDSVIPFDSMWDRLKKLRKEKSIIVLFGSEPFSSALRMSNIKEYKYDWKWNKMQGGGFLNSKKRPLTSYEDVTIFSASKLGNHTYNPQLTNKDNYKIRPIGKRKKQEASTYGKHNGQLSDDYDNTKSYPTDIITESSKQKECNSINRAHPTQKPVALMEYLIKTYTNEGDTVLDFTMGSGSTGVACINTNRKFIGIELDENYFDIAKKRIENCAKEKERANETS